MDIILETPRLILKRLKPGDESALVDAINHPDIAATTLEIPHPYTLENAADWIRYVNSPDTMKESVSLTGFHKDSNEIICAVSLDKINTRHLRAEIGYWCRVSQWNHGFMTEAADRMIDYGFDELNLERIYGICFQNNSASARVMEKLGMTFEGTARSEYIKNGTPIDFHHYAILRSDLSENDRSR